MAVSQADIDQYVSEVLNNSSLTEDQKYKTLYDAANQYGVQSYQVAQGLQNVTGNTSYVTPEVDRYISSREWSPLSANTTSPTQADVNTYVNQARNLFGGDTQALYDFLYNQAINYGVNDNQLGVSTGFDTDVINQFGFDKDLGLLLGAEDFTPAPNVSTQDLAGRYTAYDQRQGEGLTDYYNRLRSGRSGGILGTRDLTQGMLTGTAGPVTPESSQDTVNKIINSAESTGEFNANMLQQPISIDGQLQLQQWFKDNPWAKASLIAQGVNWLNDYSLSSTYGDWINELPTYDPSNTGSLLTNTSPATYTNESGGQSDSGQMDNAYYFGDSGMLNDSGQITNSSGQTAQDLEQFSGAAG